MTNPTPHTTVYHIAHHQGRTVIEADGKPIAPSAYCDCIVWDPEAWVARNRDFVESGVHLYFLAEKHNWEQLTTDFWTDDGGAAGVVGAGWVQATDAGLDARSSLWP
mgnify:CR=1 FL=1